MQAVVGWCVVIGLAAFEYPVGVAGESRIGRDPILGVSLVVRALAMLVPSSLA